MRRAEVWLMLAIGIGIYIGMGGVIGYDASALREDVFGILFGAALGLTAHWGWQRDDKGGEL